MTAFDLLDYRREVAALYAVARDVALPGAERCRRFREGKDRLFRDHPASPLDDAARAAFSGLSYAPYDPRWRVVAQVDLDVPDGTTDVDVGEDGRLTMRRAGYLRFALDGQPLRLTAYWIGGYGGGLFVPFRDATSGGDGELGSYGGGRYLLDTIKHADLGSVNGGPVLDFNYAYAPSCAHHPRWVCPLSPPENRLEVAVSAGEMNTGETDVDA